MKVCKRFALIAFSVLLLFCTMQIVAFASSDEIETNTMPYSVSGLQITSVSFTSTKGTATIKNDTGVAIDSLSHIAYKCYDSSGTVVKSSNLYLENLNAGESCKVDFYYPSGTKKVLFSTAKVYAGNNTSEVPTVTINGIQVNELPYSASGLQITSVSFTSTKGTATVKNDTGVAIDSLSYISYKCYDSSGTVVKSSNLYLENLNAGESCKVDFYYPSGTKKVLFSTAKVYAGNNTSEVPTVTINGIQVNELPYSVSGLQITSVSFTSTKGTATVKNDNGVAIDSLSYISYKCYDSSGTVVKSSSLYLENLNAGESCKVDFYYPSGTKKVLFSTAKIYAGTASSTVDETTISGMRINALPYSTNNLTISKVSVYPSKVTVHVINHTGIAVDGLTYISYKCYDSDNCIVKSSNLYVEEMNPCEACDVTIYLASGTKRITFYNSKITRGTSTGVGTSHAWEEIAVKDSTCKDQGERTLKCKSCGTEQKETIPLKAHDWEEISRIDSTCTAEGEVVSKCKNCGTEKTDSIKIKNHTYGDWVIVKQATYTETGLKERVCSACEYKESAQITKLEKKQNTLTVKPRTVTVKYAKVKKKAQTVKRAKALTVSNQKGTVTYKLSGVVKTKYKKYFVINAKTGNITVKKRLKKGTYKVKIKVTAAGTNEYKSGTKTVTTTIKVK